jgi:DNA-binding NtrC family response regulator
VRFASPAAEEDHLEAVVSDLSCEPAAEGRPVQAPARPDRYCIIVDDDPGICKALSFTMRKLGFETTEAASPATVDAQISERMPELIFLDLGLGKSDAMDVLPILARHGYGGLVQLMSGGSQEALDEVAAAGERYGLKMLPALPKPFRMGVVKDLVASLDRS